MANHTEQNINNPTLRNHFPFRPQLVSIYQQVVEAEIIPLLLVGIILYGQGKQMVRFFSLKFTIIFISIANRTGYRNALNV